MRKIDQNPVNPVNPVKKQTWVRSTLGRLGAIGKGAGISREESHSGELPAVRYGELYTHHNEYVKDYVSHISPQVASRAVLTRKGDVVFAGSGETPEDIGKCAAILDEGVYAGGDLVVFSPPANDAPIYWGCLLNMPEVQRQKAGFAHGSSIYHLRPGEVAKISVTYVNDIDAQRHIAEVLATCDEVIAKSERAAEKYRQIKAGLLRDLLTRGLDEKGHLRPAPEIGVENRCRCRKNGAIHSSTSTQNFNSFYKPSPLGPIPKEWEVMSVDGCFEFLGNNTFARALLDDQSGRVYDVHYGDVLIKYDTVIDCYVDHLPSLRVEAHLGKFVDYVQDGDLIVADTAEDDTVGKAVELVNVGELKVVSGLHTILMRPKVRRFASRWLGYFVNSDVFHSQLLPYVVGSKVSSISRGNIKRVFVVIPKESEQRAIAARLAAVDARIAAEVKAAEKYRRIKAGLMERLLTPPNDTEIRIDP